MVKHLRYIITMYTHTILRKNILKKQVIKNIKAKDVFILFDHTKAAVSVVSV